MAKIAEWTHFVPRSFVELAHYLKCAFEQSYRESKTLADASAELLDAISYYDAAAVGFKWRGYPSAAVDVDKVVRLAEQIDMGIAEVETIPEMRVLVGKLLGEATRLRDSVKKAA